MANYKRIKFAGGPVTAEKLNALTENTDYLYENMIRGYINVNQNVKTTNLRVQGFMALPGVLVNNNVKVQNCYWPQPFSPGCSPVIATCLNSDYTMPFYVTVQNLNGTVFPDNIGFKLNVATDIASYGNQWGLVRNMWYSILALGF